LNLILEIDCSYNPNIEGAAAKRKQQKAGSVVTNASVTATAVQPVFKGLDESDIAGQLEKAKNGTHEELLRRKSLIDREIEKKIAAADRLRKLQIKNINDLYEFEVVSFQTQFQVFASSD
jgi:hypothetical protein